MNRVSARVSSLPPERRGILTAALAAALLLPGTASAAGFRLFHSTAALQVPVRVSSPAQFDLASSWSEALATGHSDEDFDLDLQFPASPTLTLAAPEPVRLRVDVPPRQPHGYWIGALSAGAVLGSAYNAWSETPDFSFHTTNEGYFGRDTYAGGADKASHFVSYYGVSRIMTGVYEVLDLPREPSYSLAFVTSSLAGLATEIGDGTNKYGFSYEDLVIDVFGAASAYVIARYGLDDMLGFRAGLVPAPDTPPQYETAGIGKDYSNEIYTADFKLAGLARRVDRNFGPARFLLLSLTYGVKGYPYALEELRERQVGLEVGLNVAEAARAIGVPENRWWGKMLLIVLDILRFPYTAIGVRYDINNDRWVGPDTGNTFKFP
jgi:hypothetical protein